MICIKMPWLLYLKWHRMKLENCEHGVIYTVQLLALQPAMSPVTTAHERQEGMMLMVTALALVSLHAHIQEVE